MTENYFSPHSLPSSDSDHCKELLIFFSGPIILAGASCNMAMAVCLRSTAHAKLAIASLLTWGACLAWAITNTDEINLQANGSRPENNPLNTFLIGSTIGSVPLSVGTILAPVFWYLNLPEGGKPSTTRDASWPLKLTS